MKFTILRRISQILILTLFILGNVYGIKILQGDLSSSRLLNTISLNDPYALLQLALASLSVNLTALFGTLIVLAFYVLIAPRAFCSFVCPVNILTDLGAFIRKKLRISKNILNLSSNLRYYLLILSLIFSFLFKIPAFESVSFVGAFTRAVVFLSIDAVSIALLIIIFEVFITSRGICSHICPLGAFWVIVSKFSLIRIKHTHKRCTRCNRCKVVCPERQVLEIIGKQSGFIKSPCISCGRCIEACNDEALEFSIMNFRRNR
ncbi:MAG: quinol dehydrogenase ferredoxin subunit NapH [Campylobacter sp.]|nr:quinol dehydrogenase ferredoxin subunit NapH [Campylobacter sp.]